MKKEVLATFILVLFVILISVSLALINSQISRENTNNIILINNTIKFDSLTLKQKLAQMIIVYGESQDNLELTKLNIGGLILDDEKNKQDYQDLISKYQDNSKIKLFVTTDMEGAWNPFSSFENFPKFSDIKTNQDAYNTGLEEGKLLKEIGFNLNFAPVAEFSDEVYGGRAFLGTKEDVEEKLSNYIRGLQENTQGTCKHYPGKGMINNLHNEIDRQTITSDDLELFQLCVKDNISSIMIGHQIVSGEINSNGKPSSVSPEVMNTLQNFSGLIISDEINMHGLSNFYPSLTDRYERLINSGENVILDFNVNSYYYFNLLNSLEKSVKEGKISEEKINESVKKILTAKGYSIN